MDFSEKRDFHRMALECSMEYQLENDNQVRQGKVINLSAKGVLFITSDAILPEANVNIKLVPVNKITPPMSADIQVTRCDKTAEDDFQIAAAIIQIHQELVRE